MYLYMYIYISLYISIYIYIYIYIYMLTHIDMVMAKKQHETVEFLKLHVPPNPHSLGPQKKGREPLSVCHWVRGS